MSYNHYPEGHNLTGSGNDAEIESLEREVKAANKKAKEYFEAMKRVSNELNEFKAKHESLMKDFAAFVVMMEQGDSTNEITISDRIDSYFEKFTHS